MLVVAWGWTAANGWRGTSWRVLEVVGGGALEHGVVEVWVVGLASVGAMVCFAVALRLVMRQDAARESG